MLSTVGRLEEKACNGYAVVQHCNQSNADLRKKLTEEEKARRNADSALESTERQAKDQRQRLREAND